MLDLPPFAEPRVLFELALGESSGLAVAGDRVYTLEDSGNPSTVTVLDRSGVVVDALDLPVENDDWEDLAVADGALWVADTGDNRERREQVQVHRVGLDGGPVTTYRFRYADEPHDAEALLVLGGRVVVVTKELLGGGAYAAVPDPDGVAVLERVADVRLPLVTGGAVSPDGRTVALRTYTHLYEWPVTDDLLQGEPVRSDLPVAEQGEAVAYDGLDAVLLSTEGEPAPVHRLTRTTPTPAPTPTPTPTPTSTVAAQARPDAAPDRRLPLAGGAAALLLGVLLLARRRRP